jgi:MHS family proline/betaine transporter-like MFS transporter
MKLFKNTLFLASIGTFVEYYDSSLFIIFFPLMAPTFFPHDSLYVSLLKSYLILALSAISRPLGGVFFGYIGDYFGRKRALLSSLYGIAIATLIIGITPGIAKIGMAAIIIIVVARTVQVLSFGGEYNGAAIYAIEHAKGKQEGLIGSAVSAITLSGSLVAILLGLLITLPSMPAWTWRLSYIFGGIVGFCFIYLRKNLIESPVFKPIVNNQYNFRSLLQKFPRQLVASLFIGGFITTPFTTIFTFITPVLVSIHYLNPHQLMLIYALLTVIAIITTLCSGYLTDYFLYKKIMWWANCSMLIMSYPLLLLVDSGKLNYILFGLIGIIVLTELFFGPSNAYLKNLFPAEYRYRGTAISFGVGYSLFGSLTPIIEYQLYNIRHHFADIYWWLFLVSAGLLFSLWLNRNHLLLRPEHILKTPLVFR